jgi:hypothetical protein
MAQKILFVHLGDQNNSKKGGKKVVGYKGKKEKNNG